MSERVILTQGLILCSLSSLLILNSLYGVVEGLETEGDRHKETKKERQSDRQPSVRSESQKTQVHTLCSLSSS